MRNDETGEIAPRHMIGTTQSGKSIYCQVNGWSPVAEMKDGTYRPSTGYRCNADGHYVIAEDRDRRGWSSIPPEEQHP